MLLLRQMYQHRLKLLPVANPSKYDLARVAPHLTDLGITTQFGPKLDKTGYVALPATSVRDTYLIAGYCRSSKGYEIRLAQAGRVAKTVGHKCLDMTLPFKSEAIAFANDTWEENLADPTSWADILTIRLEDPSRLTVDQTPALQFEMYVAVNTSFSLLTQDLRMTPHEKLDKAVRFVTADKITHLEMLAGRHPVVLHCCANCGSSFEDHKCPVCQRQFKRGFVAKNNWQVALPAKLVDFAVRNGHLFRIDPAIARIAEYGETEEKVLA